jgi:GTP-binding protein YchF
VCGFAGFRGRVIGLDCPPGGPTIDRSSAQHERKEAAGVQVALVGLLQSGKTTLFSAVSGRPYDEAVQAAAHERAPLAVVHVPDPRLEFVAALQGSPKVTHAAVNFLDLSAVDPRLSESQNRRAVTQMRDMDCLVHVVRAFQPPGGKPPDPAAEIETLTAELLLADQMQVEARIQRIERTLTKPGQDRKALGEELELQKRCLDCLNRERPLREAVQRESEEAMLRSFAFLTLRPLVRVINIAEAQIPDAGQIAAAHGDRAAACIACCAKIESELAELQGPDRKAFMEDLGLKEPMADRLVHIIHKATESICFLTAGTTEARAWTVPRGTTALEAAGKVHTDMARGFIRAETVAFADLEAAGDIKAARAVGHVRLEGKQYVVQDGDLILFRFNV